MAREQVHRQARLVLVGQSLRQPPEQPVHGQAACGLAASPEATPAVLFTSRSYRSGQSSARYFQFT